LQIKPGTDLNQLVIRTSQWEHVGVAALPVLLHDDEEEVVRIARGEEEQDIVGASLSECKFAQ